MIVTWMMKERKECVLGTERIPCYELQSEQFRLFCIFLRSFSEDSALTNQLMFSMMKPAAISIVRRAFY